MHRRFHYNLHNRDAGCGRRSRFLGPLLYLLAVWVIPPFRVAILGAQALQHPASRRQPFEIQYRLHLARPTTHLIDVEIDVGKVAEPEVDFAMPAWAPGRYAIYNFAKNVQEF